MSYRAWVVEEIQGEVVTSLQDVAHQAVTAGNVLIKTEYSAVNYKDYLATQTHGGVIRQFPMTPGIDVSGVIIESTVAELVPGELVVVTGFDLGTNHPGGWAEYVQVPASWVIALHENFSTREAMIVGTAGFTAAQAITKLENHGMTAAQQPRILVTGATGGVGTIAVDLLHAAGYENVTAALRKEEYRLQLEALGATRVITATELTAHAAKLLQKQTFDFVIDTVGGDILAAVLPQVQANGAVAALGNAGGVSLNTNVLPFILRGINLLGVDSVLATHAERLLIWRRLAAPTWRVALQSLIVDEVAFAALPTVLAQFKQGTHVGRSIIKL